MYVCHEHFIANYLNTNDVRTNEILLRERNDYACSHLLRHVKDNENTREYVSAWH